MMTIKQPTYLSWLGALMAGALLAACGGGPTGTEFVAACLQEGRSTASQLLDKELGVSRQAFCECGEPVARASLSTDGYRAIVLQMQGKVQEASAITSKMSDSEQASAVEVLGKMVEQCGVKQTP